MGALTTATTKAKKSIFKTDDGKLSTGAKIGIGAGALAIGAFLLGSKRRNPQTPVTPGSAYPSSTAGGSAGSVAAGAGILSGDGSGSPDQKPKSNTVLYIGVGVGVLVVAGIILYAVKK